MGETVEVGAVMALIATDAKPGEAHSSEGESVAAGTSEAEVALEAPGDAGELQGDTTEEHAGSAQEGAARRPGGRRYSPVVMRMAAEHDLDLEQIEGTGRGGRVRKQDVLAFLENGGAAERADAHRVARTSPTSRAAPKKRAPRLRRRRPGSRRRPPAPRRSRACASRSAARWSSRCAPRRRARRSSRPT